MIPIKCMFLNINNSFNDSLSSSSSSFRHNIIIDLFIDHHIDIECDSCPFKVGGLGIHNDNNNNNIVL